MRDATGTEPVSEGVAGGRWIDRLDRRVIGVVTALGFGLPVAFAYWMVAHYGVNGVTGDQFSDVTVIHASYTHLTWGALWAQHNENRIFFANLIMLVLAHTTAFNIQIEEFLGVTMLVAATAVVILIHRRRAQDTPWLYYCPVAILMLSVAQFGNMLWGFQMAWFLVMVSLVLSLFFLDRLTLGWLGYGAAIVMAVVASYSSLQGLLVWPAGLFLLYHRHRRRSMVVSWVVVAAADTALYFYNYDSHVATSPHGEAISHLAVSAEYFGLAVGDVLGIPFHYAQGYNPWLVAFGLVIVAVCVWVIARYGIRRDEHSARPFAVSLVLTGLLFVAVITEGRIIFGAWSASASRYTTFDLLIPTGIYLTLLGREPAPISAVPPAGGAGGLHDAAWRAWRSIDRWAFPVLRGFIAVLIVAQVAVSIPNAMKGARSNFVYQTRAAEVLRDYQHLPDNEVVYFLDVYSNAHFVRRQAAILKRYHLSVFADPSPPQGLSPTGGWHRQGRDAGHEVRTGGTGS
jgi:hypothetical protein